MFARIRLARLAFGVVVSAAIGLGTAGSAAATAPPDMFSALSSSMTTAREAPAAAPLPDGQVLIAGGFDSLGNVLASAEAFDPSSGSLTVLPQQMTEPRALEVAAPLPDGKVLIAGGENNSGFLSSAEVFDPSTGA